MSTESAAPPAPLASTAPSAAPSFNALDTARMLLLLLLPRAAAASNACKRLDIWASCEWRRLALGGSSALLGAIRIEPLRRDNRRCEATAPEAAPLSARVLLPPPESTAFCSSSIRARSASCCCCCRMPRSFVCAARCAAASPRSSKASRVRASSYVYHGLGRCAVAAAAAAAGHRGRPPRRRRLDGPRRQRGTRRSAGGSLLDAYRRAATAAGLGRGGVRTSPCASVVLPGGRRCLGQPLHPWPLVGVHFAKGAATKVVATAEVRASVTVATEARATD